MYNSEVTKHKTSVLKVCLNKKNPFGFKTVKLLGATLHFRKDDAI